MKLEKKKMATLLAAVLIAMMGVMPALAVPVSDTVILTADVQMALLYITVPVDPIVFINVIRTEVATASFVITVTGEAEYTVDLSATLIDDTVDFPFFVPLTINGMVGCPTYAENLPLDLIDHTMSLSFTVPVDALGGSHSGSLTIFAEYGPPI